MRIRHYPSDGDTELESMDYLVKSNIWFYATSNTWNNTYIETFNRVSPYSHALVLNRKHKVIIAYDSYAKHKWRLDYATFACRGEDVNVEAEFE